MIGRPCKPDNDLKGLWRTMFGTPFPACGMPERSERPRAAIAPRPGAAKVTAPRAGRESLRQSRIAQDAVLRAVRSTPKATP